MHSLRPHLLLLLLSTARSLVLDGLEECLHCPACPLRNATINLRCVDMTPVLSLAPVGNLYYGPNTLELLKDPFGTRAVLTGVVVRPSIDLSLLTSTLLQQLGVRQATIDKLEPFLHPEVRGVAARDLLYVTMTESELNDRILSEAEGVEFRTAITKYKLKTVEAYYNIAVGNSRPCFHELRNSQRSVLLAAVWLNGMTRHHPVIQLAGQQDWDGVAVATQEIVNRLVVRFRLNITNFMADDGKDDDDGCLPFDTPDAKCSFKLDLTGASLFGQDTLNFDLTREQCIQACKDDPACLGYRFMDIDSSCRIMYEVLAIFNSLNTTSSGVCKQRLPRIFPAE